ncbi:MULTISPECIES: FHA domain-containing protein [Paenarthrobacter]|uniref:FHA domain-containing protein n=1 Tax=Paenarthrobacter ureafaciens TaxID=37931 RepID=A0AAX3EKB5_PAEUR|nr:MULTISPECIES: FHA domain-containing protein [Paenarthrobacter]MDO5863433.1 FHA domain-containing protein [Paenarthrobacter sp. SD-2]MDO5874502.1 FHA domain-containing protein [Paenarthrobacter sp. SD-1]QMU81434.1 FHA domain-containing protein [Paenarthrobacter ureafaciens]UYV93908.1 FHA domain-containing protein [Paenarthrobacter ureafaciens]UYV98434.1 FHA domain-containing protein [Paenarthrobacter ureafaciens]
MDAVIGFVIIYGGIACAVGGGFWLFFSNLGRLHGLTPWQAARSYFRKDLAVGPLTLWRINREYRAQMRHSGVIGPSGKPLRVRKITVAMPSEDYRFVQQFSVPEFAKQLADYRHKYALNQGWYGPEDGPVPVAVWPKETLRRLNPVLSYQDARDGTTRPMTADAGLGDEDRTEPVNGMAWVTFNGKQWVLRPEDSPYRLGRAEGNEIRTVHDHISAWHAILRHSGGSWVLEPLKTTNATKVSGQTVTSPTPLGSGAIIMIGQADPIRFDAGTEIINAGK